MVWGAPQRSNGHPTSTTRTFHWMACTIEVVFKVLHTTWGPHAWGSGTPEVPQGVGCPTEVQWTPGDHRKNIPQVNHWTGCTTEVVFKVLRGAWGPHAWGSGTLEVPHGVGCPTEVQWAPHDHHKNIPRVNHWMGCTTEMVMVEGYMEASYMGPSRCPLA